MDSENQKEWIRLVSKPRRALLIDDDSNDCDLIVRMSDPFNIIWEVVSNGTDAIKKIKDAEHYDLIFMDLQLGAYPEGVDLFREIKTVCPKCPILVFAGYITNNTIADVMRHGFAMFAQKPESLDSNFFSQLFLALNIPRKGPATKTKEQEMRQNV